MGENRDTDDFREGTCDSESLGASETARECSDVDVPDLHGQGISGCICRRYARKNIRLP